MHGTRSRSRLWVWLLLIAVSLVFQLTMGQRSLPAADGERASGQHADGEKHPSGGHSDPIAPILLGIVLILFLAKLGGDVFERIKMPAVLGELTVGVLLGNFALMTGSHVLDFLHPPPGGIAVDPYNPGAVLKMLAGIGVILLLFEVGLESTVADMMKVGVTSFIVAVLGVVAPMGLGWLVAWLVIPEAGWQAHVFIGATLCATSVGITARVLRDLGRSQQRESQIILGAAVIDDVLGLLVLAIVSGIIQQGADLDVLDLVRIVVFAFGFLAGAVLLGTRVFARPLFKMASYLQGHDLLVPTSLVVCFGFSWLANLVGLAPIVGAFAAGLILEHVHYRELGAKEHHDLEEALKPLTAMLVPIFFVQMGIGVDLRSFAEPSVWGLAAGITVVAIIGKQACALGVREPGLNATAVGLGMIPRGEVGLIFADVGRGLVANGQPVVDTNTYSAVIVMVLITTMVTPPLLKWSMVRGAQPVEDPTESAIKEMEVPKADEDRPAPESSEEKAES
ncbi:MAG: cation:proton antiporter [Gemmataceae bacterium]